MGKDDEQEQVYTGSIRSPLDRRMDALKYSLTAQQLLEKTIEALASDEPATVALGVEYIGRLNNKIHINMGGTWTEEDNKAWQRQLVENILQASSGERKRTTTISPTVIPTGESEKPMGFTRWDANQRQEFLRAVSNFGVISTNPPVAPPTQRDVPRQ